MKNLNSCWLIIVLFATSCAVTRQSSKTDDGLITVNLVQVNDVYEIAPLNGGKEGGMARVATIKKKYLKQNLNTFLIMAGDFLSPSVYNSLQFEGKAIRGKQMVEAMNVAGVDIAIFGNHEFDIKESELQSRINESHFQWVSSNTYHQQDGKVMPFIKYNTPSGTSPFPETLITSVRDADGTLARIGFIGLTLPFNRVAYVNYSDGLTAAKKLYSWLKDSVDAVVAITHQSLQEDEILAREIPGLALIIGGHEHDQRFEKVGNIYITKALSNAKSAYVLTLTINKKTHTVNVVPKQELLNETIAPDSATNVVVQKWVSVANASYSSIGFDANRIVLREGAPLDGREPEIRSHATNLTKLIVNSIKAAAPHAEVALMNSGSIRVDDILQMPVTEYDIIRTLPYGGGIKEADMAGSLLIQILNVGLNNKNTGGYLHYNDDLQFDMASGKWSLNHIDIDPLRTYRVAMSEFLFSGGEANLGFLKPGNKDISRVYDIDPNNLSAMSDLRKAVIEYLLRMK